MGILINPSRWNKLPEYAVTVNWGHPLAENLTAVCVANACGVLEVITNRYMTAVGSPVFAEVSGVAGQLCGANSGFTMNAGPMVQRATGMSAFVAMGHKSSPAANAEFFGIHYTNTLTSPFSCCVCKFNNTSVYCGQMNSSGTLVTEGTALGRTINNQLVTMSYHVGGQGRTLMVDAGRTIENSTATTVNFGTTPQISVCDSYPQNIAPNTVFSIGYLWAGVQMKGTDLTQLHFEPYALLSPRHHRRYPKRIVYSSNMAALGVQ
jgi:hypothetical protein